MGAGNKFEEWHQEFCDTDEFFDCINGVSDCEVCEQIQRATWKGALRRVLRECYHYKSQEVIDWILEELKE